MNLLGTKWTPTFLAKPDQLSALVTLANYGRAGGENVIMPAPAVCQAIDHQRDRCPGDAGEISHIDLGWPFHR